MPSRLQALRFALGASICLAGPASAFVITIDPNVPHPSELAIGGAAYEDNWNEWIFPESYPFVTTRTATSPLGGVDTMSIDFSESRFAITCDIVRVGEELGWSSCGGHVVFRVDEAVEYRITGSAEAVHEIGEQVGFGIYLQEATAPFADLFRDDQQSQYSANASFDASGWGGDASNSHSGALSGTLEPNRPYAFAAGLTLQGYVAPSQGSAATAQFVLSVPEPAHALQLATGVALLGLHAACRRGRSY